MAQIVWQTPKGDLGTYPEESEFSYQLVANNSLASPLTYKVISGSPPPGIQLYSNGLLYGIPVITTPGKLVFTNTVLLLEQKMQMVKLQIVILTSVSMD